MIRENIKKQEEKERRKQLEKDKLAKQEPFKYPQQNPKNAKDTYKEFGGDGLSKLQADTQQDLSSMNRQQEKVLMELPKDFNDLNKFAKNQNYEEQSPKSPMKYQQQQQQQQFGRPIDNQALINKNKELTDRLIQSQKDSAKQTVQIEELVKKVKELEQGIKFQKDFSELKNKLKKALVDQGQKFIDMDNRKNTKFDDLDSMETQRPFNQGTNRDKAKYADLDFHQNMLRQKSEFERDLFRKQMLYGVGLIDDGSGLRIYGSSRSKSKCRKCCNRLSYYFDKATPLSADIRKIGALYDKSVESFFIFFRYMVALALLTLIIFLPMLIVYILDRDTDLDKICASYFPCVILYSRFTNGNERYYVCTILGFMIVVFAGIMEKWIAFNKMMKKAELKEIHKNNHSRMLFNIWDWSIDKKFDMLEMRRTYTREIRLTLDEDKIKAKILSRTKAEKAALFFRRIGTFSLSVFILCIGWSAIIAVNYYEREIKSHYQKINTLKYIANFMPTVVISLVNVIIPAIIKKITLWEKWDYAKDLINQQIARLYFSKILNVVIFAVLNIELATSSNFFRDYTIIDFTSSTYDCREDQAGINMVRLLVTETVLTPLIYIVKGIGLWIFSKMRRLKSWKSEYQVSSDIVWIIYYQSIFWLSLAFFPYIAAAFPIFLYLLFKFLVFHMKAFKSKARESSNSHQTGFVIMVLLNMTFVLIMLFYACLLYIPITHQMWASDSTQQCGPFESGTYLMADIDYFLDHHGSGLKAIHNITVYYPLLWLVILLLAAAVRFKASHVTILKRYIEQKNEADKRVIDELQTKVAKYKKKGQQTQDYSNAKIKQNFDIKQLGAMDFEEQQVNDHQVGHSENNEFSLNFGSKEEAPSSSYNDDLDYLIMQRRQQLGHHTQQSEVQHNIFTSQKHQALEGESEELKNEDGEERFHQALGNQYDSKLCGMQQYMTIRVFLYFEDKKINEEIKDLLKEEQRNIQQDSIPLQYDYLYIDIAIPAYITNRDLIMQCIDVFNRRLQELDFDMELYHSDSVTMTESRTKIYELYMANKKGKPKDDYPDCDYDQVVSQTKCIRFTLRVLPQSLQPRQTPEQIPITQSQTVMKSTALVGNGVDKDAFYEVALMNDLVKDDTVTRKTMTQKRQVEYTNSSGCAGMQSCCTIF